MRPPLYMYMYEYIALTYILLVPVSFREFFECFAPTDASSFEYEESRQALLMEPAEENCLKLMKIEGSPQVLPEAKFLRLRQNSGGVLTPWLRKVLAQ